MIIDCISFPLINLILIVRENGIYLTNFQKANKCYVNNNDNNNNLTHSRHLTLIISYHTPNISLKLRNLKFKEINLSKVYKALTFPEFKYEVNALPMSWVNIVFVMSIVFGAFGLFGLFNHIENSLRTRAMSSCSTGLTMMLIKFRDCFFLTTGQYFYVNILHIHQAPGCPSAAIRCCHDQVVV